MELLIADLLGLYQLTYVVTSSVVFLCFIVWKLSSKIDEIGQKVEKIKRFEE